MRAPSGVMPAEDGDARSRAPGAIEQVVSGPAIDDHLADLGETVRIVHPFEQPGQGLGRIRAEPPRRLPQQ